MGYPMTYRRMVGRNHLLGEYEGTAGVGFDVTPQTLSNIAGDLRRLEADQRDHHHVGRYAEAAGITREQARIVLDRFFNGLNPGWMIDYPFAWKAREPTPGSTPSAHPDGEKGKPSVPPADSAGGVSR